MILLIDNYDSFVHNLARYFRLLGHETDVVRNDQITVAEVAGLAPEAVVISPGPGIPADAGVSIPLVRHAPRDLPILGICLGHQVIAEACGGRVIRGEPMHGRASWIEHDGNPMFREVPNPFLACRYHSLQVDRTAVPGELAITAWTGDGTIMAVQHRLRPLVGLQFHPESVLTQFGMQLCRNFLQTVGRSLAADTMEL